ncbi:Hint domain-containing protein, partial [Candidatus Woesearchaeota archaeon]|nr:Hint domain-containing protein [Candidatus Woesearchaeota archaeon]
MMITIKKEGIKKRGTIKKQISLFWIVLIISLFQIGIAYASNNHTFFKYKYYPSDESANFTSPGIGAFILQDLTSEDISGGNFSSTVQLFDDSYYLCHSGMGNSLCDYMKNPENSDDLSDYKIFFELYDEFDNITYGGTYRDENAVFQGGDGTTLVEQDYRNMTIGFCDPDEKSGDQCKTCKLGYDLSNEEETIESRTWDSETEECCGDDYIKGGTTGGPSMDYRPDFLYQHVDEPDFSEYFCERCPLGNDKENPSLREWNPTAHCCGDDANLWYSDRDHNGTFTSNGDGFNNYNDCAKLVSGKQYLCNVHETNNNNSKWHNAPDEEGDIIFLPCIPQNGMEAMSDGYTWWGCGTNLNCPTSTSQHQFTGKFFENEKRFTFIDGWKTSYFCTSPPNSSKQYTIYECQGDRSARSSQSGIQFSTGESFGYPGNKVYYCAYQTDTISVTNEPLSTLNTQSTLWTTDLDLTNKNTCEKAGFIWTGKDEYHLQGDTLHNFCCSEADDNETTIDGESYNDPEGNGICFRSKYQPNNAFVFKDNHTYTEVYVMNGTQHGCALDDQAALSNHCSGRYGGCTGAKPYTFSEYYNADTNKPYDGSFPGAGKHENDFLIDMKNKPNPGYQTQPSGAERECPNLGGAICIPDCVGKECGDDGCGGSCGETCGNGETCSNGQCCDTCQSLGYSCGTHSDGCDGTITCGSCSVEWVCHGDDYRKKEYCDSGTCITTSQQCSNGCSNGQCNGGGGGGGGGCFLEGTKIKTLKGETAIEKIQQGDIVYSYDTETNRLVENVVNELLVHEDYKDKGVILTLSNYEKLYVTLNHAFYSDSDEVFKQLKDFKDNELLSYYNKIMKKMESVTIKRIDPIGSFDIEYNLELEKEPRNYFANGVLVHNEGKGGGGAGDGNGGGTGMVIYNTKIKPIAPPKEPEPRQAPLITGYATYGTDQGILIQDHSYCDIIDKTEGEEVGKYYCSYEEKWEETGGENLTHLSF